MEPNQVKELLITAFQAKGVALTANHVVVKASDIPGEGPEFTVRFGAGGVPLPAARGEAGASFFLSGRIQKIGPMVMINARLVQVDPGQQGKTQGNNAAVKPEMVGPAMVKLLGNLGF